MDNSWGKDFQRPKSAAAVKHKDNVRMQVEHCTLPSKATITFCHTFPSLLGLVIHFQQWVAPIKAEVGRVIPPDIKLLRILLGSVRCRHITASTL